MAKAKARPGVERGDHVYAQHPHLGAVALKVLSSGKDGFTGECGQGRRHQLGWDTFLGHKSRMLQSYDVVDSGVDGAIMRDDDGNSRYVAGAGAVADTDEPKPTTNPTNDDPIIDGMHRLAKAAVIREEHAMPKPQPILFMKAVGGIANRPGLALKESTDRTGRHAKHWVRTNKDQPGEKKPGAEDAPAPASMKHGDTVDFRHGDVQGTGKIVASGADGVTVNDGEREHQVRHEHLIGRSASGSAPAAAPPAENQPATAAATAPLFSADELAHLPSKASQPFHTQEELFTKSAEALDELQGWLNRGKGICSKLGYETMGKGMDDIQWSKPGGMLFIAPLKGEKRAAEKVEADYGGDWSQLKDVVRCSIAVDSMGDIKDVLSALQKGGMELAQQPKDRFNKPLPEGYRDLMLSVKFKNGTIGEVQVHLKAMLEAKGAGHKPYEAMRTIDAKPREQWSDEDGASWQAAFEQSKQIYGDAWAKASSDKGAPDEGSQMSKSLVGDAVEWEFRNREGANFRRPKGKPGGVTDVLHGGTWKPYKGDRTAAYLYSDEVPDPLGGGMRKALGPVIFLKSAPTQAQLDAGNYAKGHRSFQGLPITVENPAGSVRSGVSKGGHRWSTTMKHDYGYIKETLGSDGDHYDCYVGPHDDATHAYVVDTMKPPHFTEPDEQKAMLGFSDEQQARDGYLAHYDNPGFIGKVTSMPMEDFKAKVRKTRDPGHSGMLKSLGGRVLLFLKSIIPGGASGDLFTQPVTVHAHVRDGKLVPAYTSTRLKKAPEAPTRDVLDHMERAFGVNVSDDGHAITLRTAEERGAAASPHVDGTPPAAGSAAKHFYVSAINGPRRHIVAGPYGSHEAALSRVGDVRDHAAKSDPFSEHYSWGTSGSAEPLKTPLGRDWAPGA